MLNSILFTSTWWRLDVARLGVNGIKVFSSSLTFQQNKLDRLVNIFLLNPRTYASGTFLTNVRLSDIQGPMLAEPFLLMLDYPI
jgi:hypothetical protein